MDVRGVRVQEAELLEAAELHLRVAETIHRDMDRDVDPQLLGELPLVANHVRLAEVRPASREGHRDEGLVVAQDLPHPVRLVAVDPLDAARPVRPEPPGLDRRVRKAERKHRSDACVAEALERRVGVLRGIHDVRPVDEGRDPGVRALDGAPAVRREDVVRPVVRGELVEDRAEIGSQGVVGRRRPNRRLPRVAVDVDEPRDDDVTRGVDDLGVGGRQALADFDDAVVLDEDVCIRYLA